MSIAVVTPWVDHPELVKDYMEAIEIGPAPDELIVVDNNSKHPLSFAEVRLEDNFGFSGGCNAGLHHATADKVVFLNNDIMAMREGWLTELCEAIEPGVLVGTSLVNPEHAQVDGQSFPYIDGWCLGGMREDFLDLGGWDVSLEEPSYYGDNLLCLEARAAGFVLREVRTGLLHKRGQTTMANGHILPSTITNKAIYEKRVRELV